MERTYAKFEGNVILKGRDAHEYQAYVLEQLNKHFRAATIEKYDDAIISMLFQDGMKKYSKGNSRLKAREINRIQKYMIKWMRSRYGPYVNVLQRKGRFLFNFTDVYKTEFGRIYNVERIPNIFVTSHALDRIEERMPDLSDDVENINFKLEYRKRWNTDPTTYDYVNLLMFKVREVGIPLEENSVLLNVGIGLLVADWYSNFGVVTTFLTPKMKHADSVWLYHDDINMIDKQILEEALEIEEPTFEDIAYEVDG